MTRLIRAEALRLRTIRSYWLLATGAIALIACGVAATAAATSFTHGTNPARSTLAIAGLAQTVALIAGALSVTTEYRHKTITPAVLITPRRAQLVAAKLITLAAAGLVFGLAATGVATAITLPLLAGRYPRRSLRHGHRRHHRWRRHRHRTVCRPRGRRRRDHPQPDRSHRRCPRPAVSRGAAARVHPPPRHSRRAIRPRRAGRRHHPHRRLSRQRPPPPAIISRTRAGWLCHRGRARRRPRCCAAATSRPDLLPPAT